MTVAKDKSSVGECLVAMQTSSFMIRYLCTALSSYLFHRRESREGLPLISPDQPLTDLTLQSFLTNELEHGRTPEDENISWIYFKQEHLRKRQSSNK